MGSSTRSRCRTCRGPMSDRAIGRSRTLATAGRPVAPARRRASTCAPTATTAARVARAARRGPSAGTGPAFRCPATRRSAAASGFTSRRTCGTAAVVGSLAVARGCAFGGPAHRAVPAAPNDVRDPARASTSRSTRRTADRVGRHAGWARSVTKESASRHAVPVVSGAPGRAPASTIRPARRTVGRAITRVRPAAFACVDTVWRLVAKGRPGAQADSVRTFRTTPSTAGDVDCGAGALMPLRQPASGVGA